MADLARSVLSLSVALALVIGCGAPEESPACAAAAAQQARITAELRQLRSELDRVKADAARHDGMAPETSGELVGGVLELDLRGSAVLGPESAIVTLVEFGDFECPACAQWAPVVRRLIEAREGKVRLVFKHLPLPDHPHARAAAAAVEAAGRQGKFWPMHDRVFAARPHLDRDRLVSHALDLGLDRARFERDVSDPEILDRIERDYREAERYLLPGAPTFILNGRRADVVHPRQLEALLDRVLGANRPRSR
jgi:protein-disulfide isomerase